jgi:hypothetical protein
MRAEKEQVEDRAAGRPASGKGRRAEQRVKIVGGALVAPEFSDGEHKSEGMDEERKEVKSRNEDG